jgi:hypothetical protein
MVDSHIDTTELENKLKLIANAIEQAANLESLFSSPNLPKILGQTAQRTIDRQDYPDFTPRYKIIRVKGFGNRPFERLTDALYNRLKSGTSFDFSLSSSKQEVDVTLNDPVARGQQRLKRFIFLPDQQLADDLAKETNQQINIKLSNLFK